MADFKKCFKCSRVLPLQDFYVHPTTLDGRLGKCKTCACNDVKAYAEKNKIKVLENKRNYYSENKQKWVDYFHKNKERIYANKSKSYFSDKTSKRKTYLKSLYDITFDEYESKLLIQNEVCAICSSTKPDNRKEMFCVDHNHSTGCVRGLLCSPCNFGIGFFKDNIDVMKESISYLKKNDLEFDFPGRGAKARRKWLYEKLIDNQSGKCAICKISDPYPKPCFSIDHNHVTNKIRGLLCFACNSGIGHFKDNPDLLQSAINYIEKYAGEK